MITISKTDLTIELEKLIWKHTNKMGTFGCFEVTIGFGGRERVDYLTYDTKGIWRCYEIKTSKQDFYSEAAWTFIGHYNYFVMTRELFEEVKNDIPKHIGVHNGNSVIKRPIKQVLGEDEEILKHSLIRSLSREHEKLRKTTDSDYVTRLQSQMERYKRESKKHYSKSMDYRNAIYYVCEKYQLDHRAVSKFVKGMIN